MLILSSQGGIAVKKTQLIEHTKNYMDMLAQGVDPISKMKIEMDSVALQCVRQVKSDAKGHPKS